MSKPTGLPAVVVDSIGGKVGSLQYLNEPFTGEVTRWLAPAVPTTTAAAIKATRESGPIQRFIAPPLLELRPYRESSMRRNAADVGDLGRSVE